MNGLDELLNLAPSDEWGELVRPGMVIVIFGKRGSGKSCLAHWITERFSREHGLLPVAVNFPRDKRRILPADFAIRDLREVRETEDAAVLIDEGSTMIPAGQKKLEELLKGFMALSRQRNQIITYIFHATADAGSRILRATDLLLFKKPSRRQIEYGSKDGFMRNLLERAKERFDEKERPERYVFVDSEEPEFRGLLENPQPSYWSEEVSKVWAGTDSFVNGVLNIEDSPREPQKMEWVENFYPKSLKELKQHGRQLTTVDGREVTPEMRTRAEVTLEVEFEGKLCVSVFDKLTQGRWLELKEVWDRR